MSHIPVIHITDPNGMSRPVRFYADEVGQCDSMVRLDHNHNSFQPGDHQPESRLTIYKPATRWLELTPDPSQNITNVAGCKCKDSDTHSS